MSMILSSRKLISCFPDQVSDFVLLLSFCFVFVLFIYLFINFLFYYYYYYLFIYLFFWGWGVPSVTAQSDQKDLCNSQLRCFLVHFSTF